jgi:hypothetical protein
MTVLLLLAALAHAQEWGGPDGDIPLKPAEFTQTNKYEGCTQKERDMAEASRKAAAERVQQVALVLNGGNQNSSGEKPRETPLELRRAGEFARLIFGASISSPNANGWFTDARGNEYNLESDIKIIQNRLTWGVDYVCLPSEEQVRNYKPKNKEEEDKVPGILAKVLECRGRIGLRDAYTSGSMPPVFLCSPFFEESNEERIRTWMHEGAHLAKINEERPRDEHYCEAGARIGAQGQGRDRGSFTCEGPCEGRAELDVADNWAQWMFCSWTATDGGRRSGAQPD